MISLPMDLTACPLLAHSRHFVATQNLFAFGATADIE
jgi:hypothetical protein